MKRILLFGVLPLALTGASCATVNQGNTVKTAMTRPAPKTPAPAPGAAAPAAAATAASPDVLFSANVDVGVFLGQAMQARQSGDFTRAVKILSQLVLVAPDDPRVLGEYGKALTAYGRYDDAVAFLDRAIQLQPADWTLYSAQGVAYDQQGKFQSAQLCYARAMQLKPGEVTIINNDALSHIQAGDYAGAEHLLNQVSRTSPDYARISNSVALLQRLKPAAPATAAAPQTAHEIAAAGNRVPMPGPAVASASALLPKQQVAVAPPHSLLPTQESEDEPPPTLPQKQEFVEVTPAEPILPVDGPAAQPKPTKPEVSPYRSALDKLKSDPTVVMQRLPSDHSDTVVQKPHLARTLEPAALVIDRDPPVAKPLVSGPRFYVQAGSFLSDARARQAAIGLESLDVKIMQGTVNGREVFRLRIGPYAARSDAQKSYEEAKALGRSDLIIVKE
ncbi:MAG TPA: tetratricopeptide repeat protein [Micropepsaceae bacterium]|nr:tetratricopeptide repeat protein [Micropepsaceae bacterium]